MFPKALDNVLKSLVRLQPKGIQLSVKSSKETRKYSYSRSWNQIILTFIA